MRILLASDLDRTLIFDNKVSDEDKEAVQRFKETEGIFAVSTGRPFNGVEKVMKRLNIKADYLILNNGALIMKDHEIVHKETIDYKVVKEIVEEVSDDNIMISVETGFATHPIDLDEKKVGKSFLSSIEQTFDNIVPIDKLEDLDEDSKENISLISVFSPKMNIEKVQDICDKINKNFGEYVIGYRNNVFIDIVPRGCSKGMAVKWVSDKENIQMDSVYTIGDSWNDDSMFEITNNSFTFYHAEEELQKRVNYVVKTVSECIDKYILKNGYKKKSN